MDRVQSGNKENLFGTSLAGLSYEVYSLIYRNREYT